MDLGPVLISDWIHADAFSLYQQELLGHPPQPDSYLMNGKGVFNCTSKTDSKCAGKQNRQEYHFQKGKTYKLSLVNTAVSTQFTFWIDGHNFTIVGTDFVAIHPYATNVVNVAIGRSLLTSDEQPGFATDSKVYRTTLRHNSRSQRDVQSRVRLLDSRNGLY